LGSVHTGVEGNDSLDLIALKLKTGNNECPLW